MNSFSLRFADPKCNPDSPVVVKWRDIEEAMKKIKDGIVRTPCMVCFTSLAHVFVQYRFRDKLLVTFTRVFVVVTIMCLPSYLHLLGPQNLWLSETCIIFYQ